ncbi:MAG: hypothetical protein Q4F28_10935 [Eubacteriales bacterium]|nr:hypothetical protein [Eubacteriales bacterium]
MRPSNEQQLDEKLNMFTEDAKKLFGTDDESMLDEWEAAELAWEQEKLTHPDEARKIESEADAGFEALMRRIEREKAEREIAECEKAGCESAEYEDEECERVEHGNAIPGCTEYGSAEFGAAIHGNAVVEAESDETEHESDVDGWNEEEMIRGGMEPNESDHADTVAENPIEASVVPMTRNVKPGRLRGKKKVLLLVAAVCVMGLGMTMGVTATGKYGLNQYLVSDEQVRQVNRNAKAPIVQTDGLEDAYKEIEAALKIPVLVLGELPEEMWFKRLILDKEHAVIEFVYQGKSIYFEEAKMPNTKGLSGMLVSDRKTCEMVYNFWLDKEIEIEENILDNGVAEYSARIELEASYYYLSGIMKKEDFINMIEQINRY